jgi:hypothetical protein
MSASGQSWKQEVSVPCVRSPVTALTRRMHPLRFAGLFGKANRLLECRLCEFGQQRLPSVSEILATAVGLPSNPGSHLRDEFRESRKLLLNEIACDVVLDIAGCLVELGSAIADEKSRAC